MKLASLKKGRDGELIVVSRDLKTAVKASDIAGTMQELLDNWDKKAPALEDIYQKLNTGLPEAFDLNTKDLAAPLPRAYQWLDASAYVNHVELVRKSRGVEMPESFWSDPLMYQGASDKFAGPNDPIIIKDENWGIDFEAEVAVITDDVPMGLKEDKAANHIKLIMITNDVSLRNLAKPELVKGFGFVQSKPANSFSPVAVTIDELGDAWQENKVNLPLITYFNDELFGKPEAGIDMTFDFAKLTEHAAKTRFLGAGTIIGSGTVSNKDRSKGSSCIVEKRMLETLDNGEPVTDFMKFGDKVTIEMLDKTGESIFGAIQQTVIEYSG